MSRYIEVDALTCQYNKFVLTAQTDYSEGVRDVIQDIMTAPSIDIVRCKECNQYTETKGCLLEDNSTRQADDFCSYGERREP